jgi:hypothetical protein
MKKLWSSLFVATFMFLSALAPAEAAKPKYQNDSFKRTDKKIQTLWPTIPFFALGDVGQYEQTMSQSRDQVRKMFFDELIGALEKLADKGAAVEVMLEPMANILMMFDQVHDIHKAKDVVNIDKTLESMFKSSFDELFRVYDIREGSQKVQFSAGTETNLLQSYIRGISRSRPLGKKMSQDEINVKAALEMYEQIDFVAYGTFSSLGRAQFLMTLHLTGNKSGVTRSFQARGRLMDAVNDLARQVFDFFQKNEFPDWETPHKGLSWLAMPADPTREDGYSWEEARGYCKARGYRLPYARELVMASSGSAYKNGGIANLRYKVPYVVADKRSGNDNYVYTPGHEDASGGPVQGASYSMHKGNFWCVKGEPSVEVTTIEKVWALIRKHRANREVYQALETVRYEIGDYGSESNVYFGPRMEVLPRLDSLDEALEVLSEAGISLNIPASLR